jgi:hypothetical protein
MIPVSAQARKKKKVQTLLLQKTAIWLERFFFFRAKKAHFGPQQWTVIFPYTHLLEIAEARIHLAGFITLSHPGGNRRTKRNWFDCPAVSSRHYTI